MSMTKKEMIKHIQTEKVITGWWGGQPIWREKTPEEKLQEAKIKVDEANLYIALNETSNEKS